MLRIKRKKKKILLRILSKNWGKMEDVDRKGLLFLALTLIGRTMVVRRVFF